jgi:hypothetical protein
MMLKIGTSAHPHPPDPVREHTISQRVQWVARCLEHLNRSGVQARNISEMSPQRCVPVAA